MLPGAITEDIDVAQLLVAAFFLFFVCLIIYLRREDQREGYPLNDPERRGRGPKSVKPDPKLFRMMDGSKTVAPHYFPQPPMRTKTPESGMGDRLTPEGDPLLAAVGPGAYVMRADKPFVTSGQELDLAPLRKAKGWSVEPGDTDPRGFTVLDAKGRKVGTVIDIWVDRAVRILRYLEVQLNDAERTVILPIYVTNIKASKGQIRVPALLARQFLNVPPLANPDQITAREEDKVNAYYAGGEFYNREAGRIS